MRAEAGTVSGLLPLLGIAALGTAILGAIGTAVFIGACLLIARLTDPGGGRGRPDRRHDSPQNSPRRPAPARRGGW